MSIQHFYQPKALLCAFVRWHCAGFKCLILQGQDLAALQQEIWAWGFFLSADSLGFICSVNFQVAALSLHLENLMSSNEAVVGDHSVELGLFWVCVQVPKHSFSLEVLMCTHKNPNTGTVGGAADRLWACGMRWPRYNCIPCAASAVWWEQHVQQPRAVPGTALLQGGLQWLPQHPLQPHLPAQHQRDLLSLHTALFYQTDPEWWVADPSELPKAAGIRKESKKFHY